MTDPADHPQRYPSHHLAGKIANGDLSPDAAQQVAAEKLDSLIDRLCHNQSRNWIRKGRPLEIDFYDILMDFGSQNGIQIRRLDPILAPFAPFWLHFGVPMAYMELILKVFNTILAIVYPALVVYPALFVFPHQSFILVWSFISRWSFLFAKS